MYVVKASGKKEEFKREKILGTLLRSGASKKIAEEIVRDVEKRIFDGITTKKILDTALKLLKNKKPEVAAVYDLKRAIMSLGPTGFPFEKYFAEVLENYGYKTEVGRIYKGKITSHEVDITAKKKFRYMIEAKYHNSHGIYTNLKVALYVYARFLDLKKHFDFPWLVTNTRLSRQASIYSRGVGMKVTGWNYPEKDNLQNLIEKKKLYPVTILKSVDNRVKEKLYKSNIHLVKNILDYDLKELKKMTRLSDIVLQSVVDEAQKIYKIRVKASAK